MREVLEATADPGIPARLLGTAALSVPADPADHLEGRGARTLRRKVRFAEKAGTTVRPVTDPAERRTLGWEDAHSDARYLATQALVTELSARGVRHLLDTATPPEQTNGLRHFQRMVGFGYVRLVSGRPLRSLLGRRPTGRPGRSRRPSPAGS